MPIYEFFCSRCQRRTSLFQRSYSPPSPPPCPTCGGETQRLYSAVAYHRSLQDIQERSGDPDKPGPDYYRDPRNIGRWVEKRFQEMGVEMPASVQETIQKARQGEMPQAAKDLQPNVKEI